MKKQMRIKIRKDQIEGWDEAAERKSTLNGKIRRVLCKNLGRQHEYSTTKMDEYRYKENRVNQCP